MASMFPGTDPFIEACGLWEDFHYKLVGEIERALAPLVPERYVVRNGERSYIVLGSGEELIEEHPILPDVAVVGRANAFRKRERQSGGTALAEPSRSSMGPKLMRALVDTEYRESFVEIRELKPRHRLVTTIEVLSPSNKRKGSPGWELYLRKRQPHLAGSANLVEIDLVRSGQRMPMVDDWPDSPYYLLVARMARPLRCEVWEGHCREPLPEIPVPLLSPDRDVPLALQPLVDAVFARSRYDQDIDYRRPLRPALCSADATWLKKRLRARA